MKHLSFESREEWAPVNLQGSNKQWFNTYGGYIIETTWDPQLNAFQTTKHRYNYPDISLMPTE